jgi:hypothetical protein
MVVSSSHSLLPSHPASSERLGPAQTSHTPHCVGPSRSNAVFGITLRHIIRREDLFCPSRADTL